MELGSTSSRMEIRKVGPCGEAHSRPRGEQAKHGFVTRGPDLHWFVLGRLVELLSVTAQRAVDLARSEAALRALAMTDELTGLYNRRGFMTLASQQLQLGERSGRPMVLFMVDVDRMKAINDTHGHSAGDEALRRVANGLRRAFRSSDVVARFGGDEFIVLAVDATATNALALASRIRRCTKACGGAMAHGRISVSIGLARFEPGRRQTLEGLIQQADRSMYARKPAH